ncbi:hypothetical protein MSAN_02523500 [Mycena sanguinolenta]|uniref:Uncharacterized protein n=1 Tax=Mycena sanguinolenta TaxID=230812 RepID=A0A8H6TZ39_9AGAR|nr:hypothetical protein MSAN_02523500 [Mycena sanguinolenta]
MPHTRPRPDSEYTSTTRSRSKRPNVSRVGLRLLVVVPHEQRSALTHPTSLRTYVSTSPVARTHVVTILLAHSVQLIHVKHAHAILAKSIPTSLGSTPLSPKRPASASTTHGAIDTRQAGGEVLEDEIIGLRYAIPIISQSSPDDLGGCGWWWMVAGIQRMSWDNALDPQHETTAVASRHSPRNLFPRLDSFQQRRQSSRRDWLRGVIPGSFRASSACMRSAGAHASMTSRSAAFSLDQRSLPVFKLVPLLYCQFLEPLSSASPNCDGPHCLLSTSTPDGSPESLVNELSNFSPSPLLPHPTSCVLALDYSWPDCVSTTTASLAFAIASVLEAKAIVSVLEAKAFISVLEAKMMRTTLHGQQPRPQRSFPVAAAAGVEWALHLGRVGRCYHDHH